MLPLEAKVLNLSLTQARRIWYDVILENVTLSILKSPKWVVSSTCTSPDCQSVPRFNYAASTSFKFVNSAADQPESFSLSYLVGHVSGQVATDTVTFGPYVVHNQTLGT
jgi:hypothetical protein